MSLFFDTHAHLDYPDYAADLTEVLGRAEAAGISRIISIGTDLESSARAIELAQRFDPVFAAVGWHPSDAAAAPDDLKTPLRPLALHPKVVAIGEIGLDYHRLPSGQPGGTTGDDAREKRKQAEIFQQQLELAEELGLNCVIHQRDSFEDTFRHMKPFAGRVRGVFHCFSNDATTMRRVLDGLEGLVSFTGIVTFKNGQNVRETLAETPLDRLMLETDAPYLAPVPYRGKRCEPAHVREIAEAVATVKSCSLDTLSAATCSAAKAFFHKLK